MGLNELPTKSIQRKIGISPGESKIYTAMEPGNLTLFHNDDDVGGQEDIDKYDDGEQDPINVIQENEVLIRNKLKSDIPNIVRSYGPKVNFQKKRYQCTVQNCPYSTPYAKDLARHMRKHTGEKPYMCQQCLKSFSRNDKLKQHMLIHGTLKPFKCDTCPYASIDAGSLRKHLRTHTNERPYKCQLCPYRGKDSSQLTVHLRHHTGDTPYICTHESCTAAFKTPSDLSRHIRIHTREKPYECPHCNYRAAVKCNLNAHVRKNHTEKTEVIMSEVCNNNFIDSPIMKDETNKPFGTNFTIEAHNASNNNNSDISNNIDPSSSSKLIEQESNIVFMTSSSSQSLMEATTTVIMENYIPLPLETNEIKQPPRKRPRKSPVTTISEEEAAAVFMSTDYTEETLQPLKKKKTTRGKQKLEINPEQMLAFQYACRICTYKGENYKAFKRHMQRKHKDVLESSLNDSLNEPVPVADQESSQKRRRYVLKANVPKKFPCTFCNVSFAKEDSLRCHIRQHAKNLPCTTPSLSFPSTLIDNGTPTIIRNPSQNVYVIVKTTPAPEFPSMTSTITSENNSSG